MDAALRGAARSTAATVGTATVHGPWARSSGPAGEPAQPYVRKTNNKPRCATGTIRAFNPETRTWVDCEYTFASPATVSKAAANAARSRFGAVEQVARLGVSGLHHMRKPRAYDEVEQLDGTLVLLPKRTSFWVFALDPADGVRLRHAPLLLLTRSWC